LCSMFAERIVHSLCELIEADLTLRGQFSDFALGDTHRGSQSCSRVNTTSRDSVKLRGHESTITSNRREDAGDVVILRVGHCRNTRDTPEGSLHLLATTFTRGRKLRSCLSRLVKTVSRARHRSVCVLHDELDFFSRLDDTPKHQVSLLEVSSSVHTAGNNRIRDHSDGTLDLTEDLGYSCGTD